MVGRVTGKSLTDHFREYSDILSRAAMHQFLGAQSWSLHAERPNAETWIRATEVAGMPYIVHLPRNPENVDFERRLAEAAQEVANSYDWSLAELAEQVATVRADVFYVRVGSSAVDGTISLRKAGLAIEAIEKMVKSAAIATANPRASGKGRIPERVKEFLADDLRMAHTRRGSFIITVAARLQDSRSSEIVTQSEMTAVSVDGAAEGGFVAEAVADRPAESPTPELDFTRRAMTTLSRTLEITKRHLQGGDDYVDLTAAEEAGMTIPMIEALAKIGSQGGASDIDMHFEWSPVLEEPAQVPARIVFEREEVEQIPRVVERLKRRAEPSPATDVHGPVVSLSRELDSEDSGLVHILADINGRVRNVGVELEGRDYDWAIYAHRHHLPFHVRGVMEKVSNRWRLTSDVSVETEFLRMYQADRMDRLTSDDAPE